MFRQFVKNFQFFLKMRERERERKILRRERNERTAEEEESIFLTLMSGGVGVGGVLSILSLIHSKF